MIRKLLLSLCLILTGCSTIAPATPTQKINARLTPTRPMVVLTPTTDVTAPLNEIPTPEYVKAKCLDILQTLPKNFEFHENVIVISDGDQPAYISNIFNLHGAIIRKLDGDVHHNSISPDQKWLAYYIYPKNSSPPIFLVVESADGKQQKKFAWNKSWYDGGLRWLDNEHITLNVLSFAPGQEPPTVPSVVVINPFTGAHHYLSSDYPHISIVEGSQPQFSFRNSSVVYNPALTLALYAKQKDDSTISLFGRAPKGVIVLWDLKANRDVATFPGLILDSEVFWLPEEKKFLLQLGQWTNQDKRIDNWFSLDQDGYAEPLTHFEDDSYPDAGIYNPSISPDGEKIAFWRTQDPQKPVTEETELFVLDIKTHALTKYCFQVPTSGEFNALGWSLDDHSLLINTSNPESYGENPNNEPPFLTYMVNFEQEWIVQIYKGDKIPVGFVAQP